jgi:hypothetical protein
VQGAQIVKSWITEKDMVYVVDGVKQEVKKGTWLLEVEVTNNNLWSLIEKNEITGFSMGGFGMRSTQDIDIDQVRKEERKTLLTKVREFFATELFGEELEKGVFMQEFRRGQKLDSFYNAFNTLDRTLYPFDANQDRFVFETDSRAIREALREFNQVIQDVLAMPEEELEKCLKEKVEKGELEMTDKLDMDTLAAKIVEKTEEKIAEKEKLEKEELEKQEEEKVEEQEDKKLDEDAIVEKVMQKVLEVIPEAVSKLLEPINKKLAVSKQLNTEVTETEDLRPMKNYMKKIIGE